MTGAKLQVTVTWQRAPRQAVAFILLVVILATGCIGEKEEPTDADIRIFASNYPLAFFAEEITGNPEWLILPDIDDDPSIWHPSIEDITAMQQCNVVLLNGATYERWLQKVSLSENRTVITSAPFRDQYLFIEEGPTHSHGPTGEHSDAGTAFTTWLDLWQATQQALMIKNALVIAGVGREENIEANFRKLQFELLLLDSTIMVITRGHSDVPLFASHPVYQYFSRRYRLNIKSVHWEPGSFPDEAIWQKLETLHNTHRAAWMIWEDEPLPESVERLEKMGIQSVVYDPCGNRPDDGDFMTVMNSNVANLRSLFEHYR